MSSTYKVTVIIELVQEESTFAKNLIEKVAAEKANNERISENNKKLHQALLEYANPYVKELAKAVTPLHFVVSKPHSGIWDSERKMYRLNWTFAVTSNNMVHVQFSIPYTPTKGAKKDEIHWQTPINTHSQHGQNKVPFTGVDDMLQYHESHLAFAYRLRLEEIERQAKK